MVDRDFIVAEIRRTAAENGGVPLGRMKFARLTGIRDKDWLGRYWARWSDALSDAGFEPNEFQRSIDDHRLLQGLLEMIESLGKWPTDAERRLHARANPGFPSHNAFRRLGSSADQAKTLLMHADTFSMSSPAIAICETVAAVPTKTDDDLRVPTVKGYVYLLKSGRFHKIGHSNDAARRAYELRLQLPEKATIVHEIETDDPIGIEAYWHRRFADRRANGEWFSLSAHDVAAFKSRRSM